MKPTTKFVSSKNGVSKIRRDSYSNHSVKWWDINKRVRERDRDTCVSCKLALKPGTGDVHHIVALSKGGVTTMSNLILLCGACHRARHSHM